MKKENYIERQNYTKNHCVTSEFSNLRRYNTPVYEIRPKMLNEILDGGLTSGLYVLAGAPSIGKTAFTLQLADSIAKGNNEVLFISFDASKTELVAKSVSRTTAQMVSSDAMDMSIARTFREISTTINDKSSSGTEWSVLRDSVGEYMNSSLETYIVEATGNFGLAQVREAVETHVANTGNAPVVFVDYLQALALSDNSTPDKVTLGLKQISRDFNTPVWTTSTISKDSYDNPVSLQSINSEAIEYIADVIVGMDLATAETDDTPYPERGINLNVLKNKYGTLGDRIYMSFHTKFNLFN